MSNDQDSARCSQMTNAGKPCRGRVMRGSHPPICWAHFRVRERAVERTAVEKSATGAKAQDPPRPPYGFYHHGYSLEEVADLINMTLADAGHGAGSVLDLKDEMAVARVAVRRILIRSKEELPPESFARMAELIFRGADTIGRLVRIQRVLEGETADSLAGAVAQALDELGEEWGVKL